MKLNSQICDQCKSKYKYKSVLEAIHGTIHNKGENMMWCDYPCALPIEKIRKIMLTEVSNARKKRDLSKAMGSYAIVDYLEKRNAYKRCPYILEHMVFNQEKENETK